MNNLAVLTVNGKLGTANIVKVFVVFLTLLARVRELIKNFSLPRLVSLGLEIVQYGNIIVVGRAALAEFKDLTPEEAEEAKQKIIVDFDIEDDAFEAELEEALNLVEETYDVVTSGLMAFSKWKTFISGIRILAAKKTDKQAA